MRYLIFPDSPRHAPRVSPPIGLLEMAVMLKNPIMKVQEICQQWRFPMPKYSEVAASMTEFGCECTIIVEGETKTFFGKGRNKKSAKTISAEGALAFIETDKPHLLESPPLPVSCIKDFVVSFL